MNILETRELSIGYPHSGKHGAYTISSGLNLGVVAGELVCLVGPNGAGKSTLLRTLTRLQKPLAGEIYLQNRLLDKYRPKELAQQLGMVLTGAIQVGAMRVEELVGLGRFPYTGWNDRWSADDLEKVNEAIRMVGAESLKGRYVNQLSDGERQRVMIARAVAQEPSLLVLDEPTAFLDLPGRMNVMQLLRSLAHTHGKAVLSSTHDLDLALRMADRIWLMAQDGRLVSGSPEDLAMQGHFGQIFDKPGVSFDRMTGSFRMLAEPKRSIVLDAKGIARVWTEKALERAGFAVLSHADEHTPVVRVIEDGEIQRWVLQYAGLKSEHSSIYSLLISLKS